MEEMSKYDNVAYLLTDLCGFYSDEELQKLTALSAQMKRDIGFRKKYLKYLKLRYIKAIPSMLKGTYKKISFSSLHKNILSRTKNDTDAKSHPFIPEKTRC